MNEVRHPVEVPYPGLRPFEEADGPIFFGRQRQVAALLRKLEAFRFVAVIGSSGSGKSSLVKAGLLPAVREGFLMGSDQWETILIRPGRDPYAALARSLRAVLPGTESASEAADEQVSLEAALAQTDSSLLKVLPDFIPGDATNLLLIVDQFEELFSYRRAKSGAEEHASRHQAAAFVSMLLASCRDRTAKVWVLITMRSDFIGDCEAFLGLPEVVSRSQFLVPRLDRQQMREAIGRPSQLEDEGFEPFTIPNELVNAIINEASDRPDQLPLMQHALMRSWKSAVRRAEENRSPVRLTVEDYEKAGRIGGALSRDAEDAWTQIAADDRKSKTCREMFLLLCDFSGEGQIVRRRPKVDEVARVTEASVEEIQEIVRLFQDEDRNFLLPPREEPLNSATELDVSHEALLRQWKRFAEEWQPQERADAAELRRLADQAMLRKAGRREAGLLPAEDLRRIGRWNKRVSKAWAQRYVEPEQWDEALKFIGESRKDVFFKKIRSQILGIVLAGLTVISVTAAGFAIFSKRNLQEALRIAESEKKRALEAGTKASNSEIKANEARTLADASKKEADQRAADALKAQAATEEARQSAVKARTAANRLIVFMQFNLSARLKPLGQLPLIQDVTEQIMTYQKDFPPVTGDLEGENSVNLAHLQYGDVLVAMGKLDEALTYLQDSEQRLEAITDEDHSLARVTDLADCLSMIGTIQLRQSHKEEAEKLFLQAYEKVEPFAKQNPAPPEAQQALANIEIQLGDANLALWRLPKAADWYVKAHDRRQALAQGAPANLEWKRQVAQSLTKKGIVETDQASEGQAGKWTDARTSLGDAIAMLRSIPDRDTTNIQAQSDLFQALGARADLAMQEYWASENTGSKRVEAQKFLDDAADAGKQMAHLDSMNVELQRLAWKVQTYRGQIYRAIGGNQGLRGTKGLDTALQSYLSSLEIANRLANADKDSPDSQLRIAGSLEGVGDVYKSMGAEESAAANYKACLEKREGLNHNDPKNSSYQAQLAITLVSLAEVLAASPLPGYPSASDLVAKAQGFRQPLKEQHDSILDRMRPEFEWFDRTVAKIQRSK